MRGLRVIDLSGAFPFSRSSNLHLLVQVAHRLMPIISAKPSTAFLSCIRKKIAKARLIANPGCYATSVILALRPLADAGFIAPDQNVVCDCKSGASGAGKDPRPRSPIRRSRRKLQSLQSFFASPHSRNPRTHRSRRVSAHLFNSPSAPRAAAFSRPST